MKVAITISIVIASLLWANSIVFAAPQNSQSSLAYIVKPGDTLIGIKSKYLTHSSSYKNIQKLNRVRDAKKLRIGSTLLLPRKNLRFKATDAEILSIRGNVSISAKPQKNQYKVGDNIGEGATINTGRSSFLSLALEDGSRISLPSNSNVIIKRLRRYILQNAIDYDFDIKKGGSRTKVSPLRSKSDRFQIRTPKAVSAVRGTEFQMRVDGDTRNSISEVTEGSLNITNIISKGDGLLPAGNGLAVTKTGDEFKEKLLPPPNLIAASKTQKEEELNFQIEPLKGADKYRIILANDAGFIEQIMDKTVNDTNVTLPTIDNGRYFVRVSALSAIGIEGLSDVHSFKRKLNSVKAELGQSDDGFLFKWIAQGEGIKSYHFQLYHTAEDGTIRDVALIDEAGLKDSNIIISDIAAGQYVWRIGTVLFSDGEVDTAWTDFSKLNIGAE